MKDSLQTCRFGKCPYEHRTIFSWHRSIKYSTRHYTHGDCFVKSGKPFSILRRASLETLPYFAVKDAGRLAELEAALS